MALAPPIAGDGVAAATAAAAGGGGEPLRGDWKARPGRPGLVAVGGAGASDRGVMAPKSSSRGEAAAPTATSAGCSAGEPARAVAALASGVPKSLKSKRLPSKLVCAGGTGGAGGAGDAAAVEAAGAGVAESVLECGCASEAPLTERESRPRHSVAAATSACCLTGSPTSPAVAAEAATPPLRAADAGCLGGAAPSGGLGGEQNASLPLREPPQEPPPSQEPSSLAAAPPRPLAVPGRRSSQ
mmetsp:Transcript_27614/g.81219  ORF Transcript_27614/g.81219 Transcript_27614/m.81219 type:complete len:242 (-) Transcript_27614:234-959(-)